jgi:hypothetical protein
LPYSANINTLVKNYADPRNGERYRTERYRSREISDDVDEDVSDPEEIDDRALSSSTDDEDTGSVERFFNIQKDN